LSKASFEVGDVEKHTIRAEYSLINILKVFVDDREVISNWLRGAIGNRNSYKFNVGEKEKHDVELIVTIPLTPKFELYVDGKLTTSVHPLPSHPHTK
jgi:hypothetical protein